MLFKSDFSDHLHSPVKFNKGFSMLVILSFWLHPHKILADHRGNRIPVQTDVARDCIGITPHALDGLVKRETGSVNAGKQGFDEEHPLAKLLVHPESPVDVVALADAVGSTSAILKAAGDGATCNCCAHCPCIAMNGLAGVAHVLETGANEVHIDPALGLRARLPIDRMLAFTAALRNGQPTAGLVPHIGAA